MNKHKMIWGVLLASLLGLFLGGCSKELGRGGNEEVPGVPEKGQAVTFTVTTGVETYAVPAQDYEKSIYSLQAILFDTSNRYVTSGTPTPTASGSTSYTLPIATTGTYRMLLVANHTIPAGDLTGKTLSDVRNILVETEPGVPDAFVMASPTVSPGFTVTTGAMTNAGTINLERLVARIDVQTTLGKLKLSKIMVMNRKEESSLLAATSTDPRKKANMQYDALERFRKTSTDASMGQIYTYENSAASAGSTGSTEGTSLLVDASYDGHAVRTLEVKLPALKRNYIYSVQLMMGDEGYVPDPNDNPDPSKIKLTYNVRVVDWNNGQTFVISEEDLLKMFQTGAVTYSYGVNYTTNPNIASGVGAQGGTVSVIATATKQKLVSGTPDPTTPVETINGADKFDYSILAAPTAPDWLTVSPAGVLTVRENTTGALRTATVRISVRENPSTTTYLNVMQLATAVPTTTHAYALTGVSPASLTFEAAGSSQKLTVEGTDIELQNGTQTKTTPLTFTDVTVTKSAGADWLTVAADGTVTAAENTEESPRKATLTVTLKNDPSQTKVIEVTQEPAPALTTEYSLTVSPTSIDISYYSNSRDITVSGKVTQKRGTKIVSTRDLTLSDVTIKSDDSWITIDGNTAKMSGNSSSSSRSGKITVSCPGQLVTISVSQDGEPTPPTPPAPPTQCMVTLEKDVCYSRKPADPDNMHPIGECKRWVKVRCYQYDQCEKVCKGAWYDDISGFVYTPGENGDRP